ncbi:MAG TPA: outer membrane beta-barrel protein [Candidatus Eisenbacteria bacterium]|nr:outer membrane beta-barrel protein [Candidatus Eisenbacteria bacterium]
MRGSLRTILSAARWLGPAFAVTALLAGLAAPQAAAQSIKPFFWHLDLSGNFSYIRTNFSGSGGEFNVIGGSGSMAYFLNPKLSIVGDFGGYKFNALPGGINSTMYTYTFGPRYTFRHFPFGTVYVQGLLGGGRLNANSGGIEAGENGLAGTFGGGWDLPLTHQIDIRMIQADYLMTRFAAADGSTSTQNNVRLSFGIVFHFAER